MTPTSFDESTRCLGKPKGMTNEQCDPLSIADAMIEGHPIVISCWKMTIEELDEFRRTGRIWLLVWGNSMPPVALSGTKPFSED